MLIHPPAIQPSPNKPKTMPLPWTQISQTIVFCVLECKCMNPVAAACMYHQWVNMYVVHAKLWRRGVVHGYTRRVLANNTRGCRLAWPRTMLAPLGPKMWMVYAGRTAAICCDYINMHRRPNQADTLHQLLLASIFCPSLLFAMLLWPVTMVFLDLSAFCGVHLKLFSGLKTWEL